MTLVLTVDHDPAMAGAVEQSVNEILNSAPLLALATTGLDEGPHANTAYFAHDDDLVLYFVSERSTRHCLNVLDDPRATAAISITPPTYGEDLRGVQLAGVVAEVSPQQTEHALTVYREKFPSFAADPAVQERFHRAEGPAVLYRLRVDSLVVIDEPRFGRRHYIRATAAR